MSDTPRGSAALPPTAEELTDQANLLFHNDPLFHARVTMAERATWERLQAEGMRLTPSYKVAIRMGAITALFMADVPPAEFVRTVT